MLNDHYKIRYMQLNPIRLALLSFISVLVSISSPGQHNDLKLWYDQPAANWNEALPVGNGKLGAMVFGGVTNERLQLNEETVWSGEDFDFVNPKAKASLKHVRRLLFDGKYVEAQRLAQTNLMGDKRIPSSYQTLGDLTLAFGHDDAKVREYRRELDLRTAVASVSYSVNNVTFYREIFSSAPDNVIVMRIRSDKPGSVSFTGSLTRPGDKATFEGINDLITMNEHVGNGSGVKLVARLKVVHLEGTLTVSGNAFAVRDADEVVLLLTAATDYWKTDPSTVTSTGITAASARQYEDLRAAHVADYQSYFNRVGFDIGTSDAVYFPTDQRLKAVQRGNVDPHLVQLFFQFGRYLLISSSRPGGMPANLQGIWADGLHPPWEADYHININIQMNYWPAETTNLHELHLPFLEFLKPLARDGKKTAKEMYGINGTVAHFTTDAWHFTEPYGETQWAMWPMGLAWSAAHLWEHYLFKEDNRYLNDLAYPVMKEAALFCLEWLTKDPITGHLVSGPSISPENTFRTPTGETATMVMGPTMDHMIIRQLFANTAEASRILNKDVAFRKQLIKAMVGLAPTKVGADGRVMEWTAEFDEPHPGHRHISHLYGLHPGNEITRQRNPELLEAARKTIDYRLSHGGGHTGWSRAWIINFFARLHDGQRAGENLQALLSKSTLPNLFDNHPPFQIDGNFGATAGIAEMLLQSHAGEIEFLPALPAQWADGTISGLCARGGFEVSMTWKANVLVAIRLLSREGRKAVLRYREHVVSLDTKPGAVYHLSPSLEIVP
jgi:alpha-L-fucosidase 2